ESVRRGAREGLKIECDVDSGATRVECDVHLIETVVRNLLGNALRHARESIRVSFRLEGQASYCLCVEDDGPGIPESDRERVFDSFVQLGSRTGEKTGFGLGLAIVKRIVEWHSGTAHIDRSSALGGARVVVRWASMYARRS